MTQAVTYQRETKSVPFQGKTIVLESLTPVLSPKEKEQRKKEIERRLYDVFSKYGDRFQCSVSTGTDFTNHSQHCCPGLLIV